MGFIVPYLISSVVITNYVQKKVENDFVLLSEKQLDKVHFTIYESILDPTYWAITSIANDNDTKGLVGMIGRTVYPNLDSAAYKGIRLFFSTQNNMSGIAIGTEEKGYFVYPDPPEKNLSFNPTERPWYLKAIQQQTPVLSNPYIRATGKLTLAVSHAILNDNGKPIGVVVLGWDLENFQNQIKELQIGSSGYIMVLDAKDHIIVSPKNRNWLAKTPSDLGLTTLQNLQTKTTGLQRINLDGYPQYMKVKISDTGWKIISVIDVNELSQEVFDFIEIIVCIYFLTFLVIITVILLLTKRVTSSVEALSSAAVAFTNGQENIRVDITSNDEIGFLAKTFNDMVIHIQRRNEDISRLNRLNIIGEIAAGIAHEIRNPMTSVRGYLQLLSGREPRFAEKFHLMIEELDRANSIITEFLSLAKNKSIELKPANLNGIILALRPLLEADATIKNQMINLELAALPQLLLDEKEIRQLILNLARNGIEAMGPDSLLTIKTVSMDEKVILVIQDQGKGIDSAIIENLGLPFMTTKESGTGLGLAISYSIASRHKAQITVNTGPCGTTFYIHFPRMDTLGGASAPPPPP